MRRTTLVGMIAASAFGTAPRRSLVIAKWTPSGRPSATSRAKTSISSPPRTPKNASLKPP
jgi:hypothetical protein